MGNIDHVRLGRCNLHDLVRDIDRHILNGVGYDCVGDSDRLLFGRLQSARLVSFPAHPLDRVHDIFWLVDEGIAEVAGPPNVGVHLSDDIGHFGDRLDVIVPRLLIEVRNIIRVLHKAGRLHNFQWVR